MAPYVMTKTYASLHSSATTNCVLKYGLIYYRKKYALNMGFTRFFGRSIIHTIWSLYIAIWSLYIARKWQIYLQRSHLSAYREKSMGISCIGLINSQWHVFIFRLADTIVAKWSKFVIFPVLLHPCHPQNIWKRFDLRESGMIRRTKKMVRLIQSS